MFRIPKFIIGTGLILIICVGLFFGAVQIKACVQVNKAITGDVKVPKADNAEYSLFVENTGRLVFADDYIQHGETPGSRVFILDGYWIQQGQEFNYVETTLTLDEGIFGKITVKRRG